MKTRMLYGRKHILTCTAIEEQLHGYILLDRKKDRKIEIKKKEEKEREWLPREKINEKPVTLRYL